MHCNRYGISKAYTPLVLKQSSFKYFREAPTIPFCLAHFCFIKTAFVHFDGDEIIRGNSAFCYSNRAG